MPESTVAVCSIVQKLEGARIASRHLAKTTAAQKNLALGAIATAIVTGTRAILAANELDLANSRENGLNAGMQDRLRLDVNRLESLAEAVRLVARLDDPIGISIRGQSLPNGLQLSQSRVPFGVIGVIYEARPNVTVDIAMRAASVSSTR